MDSYSVADVNDQNRALSIEGIERQVDTMRIIVIGATGAIGAEVDAPPERPVVLTSLDAIAVTRAIP